MFHLRKFLHTLCMNDKGVQLKKGNDLNCLVSKMNIHRWWYVGGHYDVINLIHCKIGLSLHQKLKPRRCTKYLLYFKYRHILPKAAASTRYHVFNQMLAFTVEYIDFRRNIMRVTLLIPLTNNTTTGIHTMPISTKRVDKHDSFPW